MAGNFSNIFFCVGVSNASSVSFVFPISIVLIDVTISSSFTLSKTGKQMSLNRTSLMLIVPIFLPFELIVSYILIISRLEDRILWRFITDEPRLFFFLLYYSNISRLAVDRNIGIKNEGL